MIEDNFEDDNDQFDKITLSDEQYDIIYSAGYAECLRDMIKNLRTMQVTIAENDIDTDDYLEQLIQTAENTLNESSTVN